MNPQPQFSIQLTDDQWEDVRTLFGEALGRVEAESIASIKLYSLRALALGAVDGDVLISRHEAAELLNVKPGSIAKARREGRLPAAAHWQGKYSLRSVLEALDLVDAANDNDKG